MHFTAIVFIFSAGSSVSCFGVRGETSFVEHGQLGLWHAGKLCEGEPKAAIPGWLITDAR